MVESNPYIKESLFYKPLERNQVQCGNCERRCIIEERGLGFCKTKTNLQGILYCLTYGNISSISNNPIEKKPLYHFFPGTKALTVGTWGCNFSCPFCQNWEISKTPPTTHNLQNFLSPDQFLTLMKQFNSQGTSFSLNEPTLLLEYVKDIMTLMKPLGYYQTYVTNMYMTEEALNLLIECGCDAFCANVKGDQAFYERNCGTNVAIVWRNLKSAKELGAHVEVVTLVIPDENDSTTTLTGIAENIKRFLGPDTPWHCNQYYPAYKAIESGMAKYRTPITTLEAAYKIGRAIGLNYVYIGNVHGHRLENTFCPNCDRLLIKRDIFGVKANYLQDENICPTCGKRIPIITTLKEVKL
ncbi:MAG: AmmeMemoRadiSam system radical SAM enzyme [Candidatus Helarchaeota archaeon]